MKRTLIPLYGAFCTLSFVAIFVLLAGFLLGVGVPKSIDSGAATNSGTAVAINMALITAFGFFHSLMARPGFKTIWTRIIPKAAERSTSLLQSSLFLALLVWKSWPLPTAIWSFDGWAALPFYLSFAAGLILVVWSILLIDVLEFVGLRQIWQHQHGQEMLKPQLKTPALYRIVRHPMHFGTLLCFWSTPTMTVGHALLASAMTLYVLIGLRFEERALLREFGDEYATYQASVPMLIPGLPPTRRSSEGHD